MRRKNKLKGTIVEPVIGLNDWHYTFGCRFRICCFSLRDKGSAIFLWSLKQATYGERSPFKSNAPSLFQPSPSEEREPPEERIFNESSSTETDRAALSLAPGSNLSNVFRRRPATPANQLRPCRQPLRQIPRQRLARLAVVMPGFGRRVVMLP